MFEEGARLKQERGADKVFDFALGNPEIERPAAVLAAAHRVLDSKARHLRAYMPNAGHPLVREAVARRLVAATGLTRSPPHFSVMAQRDSNPCLSRVGGWGRGRCAGRRLSARSRAPGSPQPRASRPSR